MHLLTRRHARSGYAPSWFYYLAAVLFAGLGVWAATQGEWLLAAAAAAMVIVVVGGSRVMRRLSIAAEESQRAVDAQRSGEEMTHDE